MITRNNLPVGYKPYHTVGLCSNTIIGDGYLLSLGDVLPLLIGRGAKPQIWVQAISDAKLKSFLPIVEASIPLFPFVRVETKGEKIVVTVNGVQIMAMAQISEDKVDISELDLRPIGINLHGDQKLLRAGGMEISNSTFSGGGTFIGFTLD